MAAPVMNRLFPPEPALRTSFGLDRPYEVPHAVFLERIVSGGLRHLRQEKAAVSERLSALEGLGEMKVVRRHLGRTTAVLELEGGAALLELREGSATIEVAGAAAAAVDEMIGNILERLKVVEVASEEAAISFWANDNFTAICEHRGISAAPWEEVASNHAAGTRAALEVLIAAREPADGRLLLRHGPPGTGKTYALRALAREWSGWCSVHFITDPENFLGSSTCYLMQVLTSGDIEPDREREWQLLVLEDSGELLTADARERTGQALSRLLNVTDGLIGQGLNALVLVTTNEPLRKLHPAVQRPGRCWARVEFEPLPVEEANRWLAERGCERRVSQATALADLYALVAGREIEEEQPVGFASAA